ncbi:DHA2 family efflux MFS transporter permease subunit [Castellaniella defragrans]|uniref:EmrB/QacA subfamily drug resistance transporter n=1 Tax=Castellaniella defragrans TaxID=75697 RepID=A0A7W9TM15_CASDE|nr:DHA2 family efflux MFS transporter permease subunit [Castellaniella defragrans]MBB6083228.1 EmrB/QacA subfamily drug resistance transporter [Castellaniella defragrans]
MAEQEWMSEVRAMVGRGYGRVYARDDANAPMIRQRIRILPAALPREILLERHGERFKWLALLVVGMGMIAGVLASTSFNVAVPALSAAFGLGQDRVQWVVTGFLAALTLAMLPTPWLLDRYGFRRIFLGSNLLLAAASLAGAAATHFGLVVAVRIVQGIAAGLLQPLAMLVVMRLFPPSIQGRATGVLSFGIVLAPAAAPAAAGVLLDHFGWQAVFLINLPFCAVAGALGLYLLPRADDTARRPFDWYGVGVLCAGTLIGIELIASLRQHGPLALHTLARIGVVALCCVLFVRHARTAAAPIVALDLFRERSFAMGALVSLVYGVGLYASTYLIPVFLQSALGYDASLAGLALLPSGIALAVVIPLAGVLTDRCSPRWITVAGLGLFGASFVMFAARGGAIGYGEVVVFTIVGRIGLGLVIPALTVAMLGPMQPRQLGQASMVSNYTRQLGGALGVAIVAVLVEWWVGLYGALPGGIGKACSQAFMLLALTFGLALLAAVGMKRRGPRR